MYQVGMHIKPEWREYNIFSALYQVIDSIHIQYVQMEEEQLGQAAMGTYAPSEALVKAE